MFVSFLRVNALTFCGQYFSSNDVCKSAGIFVNASKNTGIFPRGIFLWGTLEMISRLADKKSLYSSMYAKLNVYLGNLRALHSAKVFVGHNKIFTAHNGMQKYSDYAFLYGRFIVLRNFFTSTISAYMLT